MLRKYNINIIMVMFVIFLLLNITVNDIILGETKIEDINNNDFLSEDDWYFETDFSILSSPVIVDLDNDNYQEIILVTGKDYHGYDIIYNSKLRKIYVLDFMGNIKSGWPKEVSSKYNCPPSIMDIDGDGDQEIVLFSRLKEDDYSSNGFIYALHHDGKAVDGWPVMFSSWEIGVPPTFVDLDNDGIFEIFVSELPFNEAVYMYDISGLILTGWPRSYLGQYYGGIGNFDDDLDKEIVITSQGSGGVGSIVVLNRDGTVVENWPKLNHDYLMPDGSIVVGDLDFDGIHEIIFSTNDINDKTRIYVLKSDGEVYLNWPIELENAVSPSLSLADLDNDGYIEIIGIEDFGSFGTSKVHAWRKDGSELNGFPIEIYLPESHEYRWSQSMSAPIILDIDEDGYQEILSTFQQFGLDAPSYIFAIEHDGKIKTDDFWPIYQGLGVWQQHTSLACGDIDNDGLLELVSAYAKHNPNYSNISYGGGLVRYYNLDKKINPLLIDWPMYHHDPQHSGLLSKYDMISFTIKPREGFFYINNKELLKTLFRNTVVLGDITIECNVSGDISKVEFYLDNILKNSDNEPPFSYICDDKYIGMRQLRILMIDIHNYKINYENNIFFFNL